MGFRERLDAILGVSAYAPSRSTLPSLDSPQVQKARKATGGQIQPLTYSKTRWNFDEVEAAVRSADVGDLSAAARLMRSARSDGVYSGVLSTRTDGLVRLPKRFRGSDVATRLLEGGGLQARSVFDEMCPPAELSALTADGIEIGVGVGELREVEGRDYKVLVRLDPEFLYYNASADQWFYKSMVGLLPVVPGDGRWVLHCPGGRMNPWQRGVWRAVGMAFVRKDHANSHKDNWEGKLANPARVAFMPQAATEPQKEAWFRRVMAWGVNTVFGLTPGYDIKLLESNGRGFECFLKTIADQNNEFVMVVCGQTVTTDGGTGFANADVHRSIRADLIKATADSLAYTINTQILPSWLYDEFGEEALEGENGAAVEWDVTPPKDRGADAQALVNTANAIKSLTEALAPHGLTLDAVSLARDFGVPIKPAPLKAVPVLEVAA